jgi:group I intron endonuclease
MIGIYKITNQLNNKIYIGQSIDVQRRLNSHKTEWNLQYPLYQDMYKYGIDNFLFEVLEETPFTELDTREKFYIDYFDSYHNGYNQTRGGAGRPTPVKLSEKDIMSIIELLQNNILSQKEIAALYNVGQDTISEINHGKTRTQKNIKYPIRKNYHNNLCTDCGVEIGYGSIRCRACNFKSLQIVDRPTREELKHLIRTESFTSIAKKYNVSDNAIKKWCKAMNLPHKKKDIKNYCESEWDNL